MKNYLIVDGYNIINAWPHLKELGIENLHQARDNLIALMVDYQSFTGEKVIIVFDAHLVKSAPLKEEAVHDVEIVFTKEHQTADSYIEKKVEELLKNRKNKVRVATSDWAEQQVVLGIGATRISARELKIELDRVKKRITQKTEDTKTQRMVLQDRLAPGVLEILEKWRRTD